MLSNTALRDAGAGCLWLLATYWLFHASLALARRTFPRDRRAQLALHSAVIFVAVCLVSLTAVGALDMLSGGTALSAAIALSFLLRRARFEPNETNADRDEPTRAWPLWTAVAGLLAGHVVVRWWRFPTDWDCLMYHLPLIDHWLQSGSLAAQETPRWAEPANSELMGTWFAAAFSGDFLVALNNVPVLVVWAFALLEVARQIGLRGWWNHAAAASCLAVDATVRQSGNASNDLMVAAFFTAGLAYALRFVNSRAKSDLFFFGACLGIVAGTKYLALGYAALLAAVFVVLVTPTVGIRKSAVATAMAAVVALPLFGYWYARNYVLTGFPLFPMGSPGLQERILHANIWTTALAFNGDPQVPRLAIRALWNNGGPIQVMAVALCPVTVAHCALLAIRRGIREPSLRRAAICLSLCLLGALAVVLVTPMLVEDTPGTLNSLRRGYTLIRYGLPFLCVAVLALAFSLERVAGRLPERASRRIPLAMATVAVFQLVVQLLEIARLVLPAIVGFGIVVFGGLLLVAGRGSSLRKALAAATVCAVAVAGLGLRSHAWHLGFAKHYDSEYGTEFIAGLESKDEAPIVVLHAHQYPFLGSYRRNVVIQPERYGGVRNLKELMYRRNARLVVAAVGDTVKAGLYAPCCDDLDAHPDFVLKKPAPDLRLFEFVPESPAMRSEASTLGLGPASPTLDLAPSTLDPPGFKQPWRKTRPSP